MNVFYNDSQTDVWGRHTSAPLSFSNCPEPFTRSPRNLKSPPRGKLLGLKPKPKSTAATKPAAGKSKKKAASVITAAAKPITTELVVPTQFPTYPFEEISDLLDHLPIEACAELTRRLLTSISSLPTGAARPWAVLKTVTLFLAGYVRTL
jgi:hypothetical protein